MCDFVKNNQRAVSAGVASGLSMACKLVRWFYSQSGHQPGLQTKPPDGGVQQATNLCFSPSLPPSKKLI